MTELSLPEIQMMRLINICTTPKKTFTGNANVMGLNCFLSFTDLPVETGKEVLVSLVRKEYIKIDRYPFKIYILKTLCEDVVDQT